MKVRENEFFKAIDFESFFDICLNYQSSKIFEILWFTIDNKEYGVEIWGNLLTGLIKAEVFNPIDGKAINIDHETILKWANIELEKYVERNKEAIMRTFPYQFKPEPTDGVRIL